MSTDLVTVLVEGTFEEQVVELAAFLSRSKPEAERNDYIAPFQQAAVEAGEEDSEKKAAVVEKLVGEAGHVAEGSSDREIEGFYNLLTALVLANFAVESEKRTALINQLVEAVSGDEMADKSMLKYRILSNIFNTLPSSSPLRFTVFNALVSLAGRNEEMDVLHLALTSLDKWLAEWQISEEQKSEVLKATAETLEKAGLPRESHDFRLRHLRSLPASILTAQPARAAALSAVATALRDPNRFDFEPLLQIPAVQALKDEDLFALLKIFLTGDLQQYKAWEAGNAGVLEKYSLSPEELIRKIRRLDLATLCTKSVSKEVPYTDIANALQVDVKDVEIWVIDVIRAGLVTGKLSQVTQTFRVYRSSFRTFGPEQWRTLEERLSSWESSLRSILNVVRNSQAPATTSAAAATPAALEAANGGVGVTSVQDVHATAESAQEGRVAA